MAATIPLIGNGDLNTPRAIHERVGKTQLSALMLGRGPLRDPFLFLEGLDGTNRENIEFTPGDYLEVVERLYQYQSEAYGDNRHLLKINFRKLVVWLAAGFPNATHFRGAFFALESVDESLDLARTFFSRLDENNQRKEINYNAPFMNGGHG